MGRAVFFSSRLLSHILSAFRIGMSEREKRRFAGGTDMPDKHSIYQDIAERCDGDVYIGVVGPVRTGKSTFIKRFMETLVLPNIEGEYDRERARDEMPQSASGKTVMTTEPKFIPDEAVGIALDGGVSSLDVKMIDCVGYLVRDALGVEEEGVTRMVMTPWSEKPMPFDEAAELGTKKVITDHSTIGILVTTDGSICGLPRHVYEEAERRVVAELSSLGKPFAIVLNSAHPEDSESEKLALELEARYDVPVALVNCLMLDSEDIRHILEMVLYEFPVAEIEVKVPTWTRALDEGHPVVNALRSEVMAVASEVVKVGELRDLCARYDGKETVRAIKVRSIDLGSGKAKLEAELAEGLYFKVLSELSSLDIPDEESLISTVIALSETKCKYDRIEEALHEAETNGYGIVVPKIEDMKLDDPKIVRHSGGYGVRLKASAPSIHMIKASIETEIDPVVGSEQQSEELLKFLLSEFEEDPNKIWETNLFGKTLYELVNEGLHSKLACMTDDSRSKLSETLTRIVNEGSGGLVCIIL